LRSFSLAALLLVAPTALAQATPAPAEPDRDNLVQQTEILVGLSAAGMAALWSLTAEQSQWYDKPPLTTSGLYHRWRENIAAGPVWDGDMRIFNGYGHIHTGAATSAMCLDNGFSSLWCTTYASLMSAYWEYGPEALVEIPSWQDLLMTGLVGARVGIVFHDWKRSILADHGELLGSHALGSIAIFLLDPAGCLTRGVQSTLFPSYDPKQHAFTLSLAIQL
jgi:hypothetical protein